jgi:hypothetical protein
VPRGEPDVLVVTPQPEPTDTVTEIISQVWPSGPPR